MRLPLIALAIPSLGLGAWLAHGFLHEVPGLLGRAIYVSPGAAHALTSFHPMNVFDMVSHRVLTLPFIFSACGIVSAYAVVVLWPTLPAYFSRRSCLVTRLLRAQYGLDYVTDRLIAPGVRSVARFFFQMGDATVLDHYLVNGVARRVMALSRLVSNLQTGYLYHYLLVMIIGVIGLFVWLLFV
jgi:NADH-quinone oxidoreductase subunit L